MTGDHIRGVVLTDVESGAVFLSPPLQLRGLHRAAHLGLILSLSFGNFGIRGLLLGRFCFPFLFVYLKSVFYHLQRENTYFSESFREQAVACVLSDGVTAYSIRLLVASSIHFSSQDRGDPRLSLSRDETSSMMRHLWWGGC